MKKSPDQVLKFDTVEHVEQLVWTMRLADLPRSEDRNVLNRTFNGEPPYDKRTEEENNIEVNRNFLEGCGNLTDARTQWNSNFLKPGDWYTVRLDSGPVHKRAEWSQTITTHMNRALKRNLPMISQVRETGAAVLLHGIGSVAWGDRRSPIPKTIPISSLMIPSETDIDMENLEYFAIFREMTPAQLWEKTHGPKVDPGWNLPLVESELKYVAQETQKQPNTTAFQFMPERITELFKQGGFWGSDAVPTIDYWDFYFREYENGTGWYRRIFLDWSSSGRSVDLNSKRAASSINRAGNETESKWLYTSGKRQYAQSWQEIIHCNFGDCSCVAPFKYHSVRSLGWMIWGLVDIQNQLDCKMTEQAFSDLMWFFRVAGQNEFNRIKKANFFHMGVIPQGISMLPAAERPEPNPQFIEMVLARNRDLITRHSAAYTRGNQQQSRGEKEKTATQVMAEENAVNTLVSGVVTMACTYETFKGREIARRLCIKNNPDPIARKFRHGCLVEGEVPPEYLDVERWDIECEPAMGAGNKTMQMAIVQYLNQVRPNLGPDAQRKVDHTGILTVTGNAQVAEDLAPIRGQEPISRSAHDAELATDRLMRGLALTPTPQMVHEDYVKVWLKDMTGIVGQIQQSGGVGTREQVSGLGNMAKHVGAFLQIMGQSKEEGPKVKQYGQALGQIMNLVKGFAQRLQQQAAVGNGQGGGVRGEDKAKIAATMMMAQTKSKIAERSNAQRTAQKQVGFEMKEQQQERKHRADLRRQQQEHGQGLQHAAQEHALDVAGEMTKNRLRTPPNGGAE
jgi:hypothetical protein